MLTAFIKLISVAGKKIPNQYFSFIYEKYKVLNIQDQHFLKLLSLSDQLLNTVTFPLFVTCVFVYGLFKSTRLSKVLFFVLFFKACFHRFCELPHHIVLYELTDQNTFIVHQNIQTLNNNKQFEYLYVISYTLTICICNLPFAEHLLCESNTEMLHLFSECYTQDKPVLLSSLITVNGNVFGIKTDQLIMNCQVSKTQCMLREMKNCSNGLNKQKYLF